MCIGRQAFAQHAELRDLRDRPASPTVRERQVVALVVSGILNKQVGSRYACPDSGADVPTEFVSVTLTEPIAELVPLNVNGTCMSNVLPAFSPGADPNHVAAPESRLDTVKVLPLVIWPPAAGANVNVTEVTSRGVL